VQNVHTGLNEKYITTFCPPLPRYSRICNYRPQVLPCYIYRSHGNTVRLSLFPR